jgi:hypothetical protein
MKGSVVRVCALMEVNVHETTRLPHAADATGRMGGPTEYEGPHEPERLIGAVLCLAVAQESCPARTPTTTARTAMCWTRPPRA